MPVRGSESAKCDADWYVNYLFVGRNVAREFLCMSDNADRAILVFFIGNRIH